MGRTQDVTPESGVEIVPAATLMAGGEAITGSAPTLKPNAIGLLQSTIIGIASSAPGQATALSLAAIIPASAYGGGPVILLTALPMLAIAFSYQRLNLWQQNCGATYTWVGRSISPYLGFMVGWIMLTGNLLGEVSNVLPLGPAVLSLIGADPGSQWGNVISATVLGGGATVLAVLGIQLTARFQFAIAAIEYAILLIFAAIGIYLVFFAHLAGTVHPSAGWLSPTGVGGKGSLVAGMLIAVYLFTGWDTTIYLNEETEQKESNPGKAAIISVAVLGIFYTLLVVAFQGAASEARMTAQAGNAMVFAAQRFVGSPWDKLMALAICLSIVGTTQAILVGTTRIAYSMGRDHVIPRPFGSIAPRYRTPVFGTVVFGSLTIAMTWLYVFSSSVAGAFNIVLSVVGVMFALFYAFTGVATSWYYRRLLARSLSDALLVGVAPLVGAVVLLWVAVQSIIGFSGATLWTLVAIAVLGLAMMAVAVFWFQAPFFRLKTESYQPPGATPGGR